MPSTYTVSYLIIIIIDDNKTVWNKFTLKNIQFKTESICYMLYYYNL